MKSTIRREYEKEQAPDGSIIITYQENRVGAHHGSALAPAIVSLMIPALLLGFFVGAAVGEILHINWVVTIIFTYGAMIFAAVKITKKFRNKQTQLTIKREGIIFEKQGKSVFNSGIHQLAFQDIDKLDVMTETVSGASYVEKSYLFAHAGGQEIKITKYVSKALAEALYREINEVASS